MAEFVEIEIEHSVAELEKLLAIDLFDVDEIRKIAQQRRDNAYCLQKRVKDRKDYLKFIKFEEDLLKKIEVKRKETGIKKRWIEIDLQMKERLQRFYRSTVERYQADVDLWMGYFRFCARQRFFLLGRKMLQRLVQAHGDKPHLWIFASQWSLKCKKKETPDYDAGRMWLVTGLQRHPNNKELYLELVKYDLELAKKASKDESKTDEEYVNKCLTCAQVSYRSAVKNITDAEFAAKMLTVIGNYPKAADLQKIAMTHLTENCAESEESWSRRADHALQHAQPPDICNLDPSIVLQFRLEKSLEIFRESVQKLSTALMWRKYIDFVKSALEKYPDVSVPDLNAELYKHSLPGAIENGFAGEEDYADLADRHLSAGKHAKAAETLERGLEKIGQSSMLWYELVRVFLTVDKYEEARDKFNMAVNLLKKEPASATISLWTMMIEYLMEDESKRDTLEELFKESMEYSTDLAQILKPRYLEWTVLTHGLDKARKLLDSANVAYPPCLSLYKKLLEIECRQPHPNVTVIRSHYENVLRLFGKSYADLWMDYIGFEKQYGDVKQVVKIYERGVRELHKNVVEDLVTSYALSF